MADLEVFLQILGQTFGLGAVFHQPDELQNAAHAVDERSDDGLDAVLHRGQNAGFRRHHGQLGEVFLGHGTHDRPPAEHALLVEQRIAQAARYHDGLSVGQLDWHSAAVAAWLDQQQGGGLIAVREQKRAQKNDDERRQHGNPDFAQEDEQQAQQVAE